MIDPLNQHNMQEYLSAFVDGELDAAQTLAVLDYLQTHPEAFDYLRDQQRLRQTAQHIALTDNDLNAIPPGLKARLNALAGTMDPMPVVPAPGIEAGDGSQARRGWIRWPGVIAAGLAVGFSIGLLWPRERSDLALRSTTRASTQTTASNDGMTVEEIDMRDAAIPVSLVRAATRVHVDCSRVAERLHAGGYPVELAPLSRLVEKDISSDVPAPDLSSVGYQFISAGPCARPLEGTVHLLYKKNGPEPRATISVFAQAYGGQFALQTGRMYCIVGESGTFPMCAWRTQGVVYFLIADDVTSAVTARRVIPQAPT